MGEHFFALDFTMKCFCQNRLRYLKKTYKWNARDKLPFHPVQFLDWMGLVFILFSIIAVPTVICCLLGLAHLNFRQAYWTYHMHAHRMIVHIENIDSIVMTHFQFNSFTVHDSINSTIHVCADDSPIIAICFSWSNKHYWAHDKWIW